MHIILALKKNFLIFTSIHNVSALFVVRTITTTTNHYHSQQLIKESEIIIIINVESQKGNTNKKKEQIFGNHGKYHQNHEKKSNFRSNHIEQLHLQQI